MRLEDNQVDFLCSTLVETDLPPRVVSALVNIDLEYVYDLLFLEEDKFKRIPNLSTKGLEEIRIEFESKNLNFGSMRANMPYLAMGVNVADVAYYRGKFEQAEFEEEVGVKAQSGEEISPLSQREKTHLNHILITVMAESSAEEFARAAKGLSEDPKITKALRNLVQKIKSEADSIIRREID